MKPRSCTIFEGLEELASLSLAESWDNSGLQLGSAEQTVNAVLVVLDVEEKAVDRALEVGANLIISHHPLFFHGMKRIDYGTTLGRLIRRLIDHDLTVYSAHTNLDLASRGLSQFLAQGLELDNIRPLGVIRSQHLFKLVVFLPESHLEAVRQAVNDAGAGFIGNYRDCSFRSAGIGTFRPLAGSNPYLGREGVMEEAAEYRLEVIVPGEVQDRVIRSMMAAHPYEEVAYDLIPLTNNGPAYSYGRQGELPEGLSLEALGENLKTKLQIDHVSVCGSPPGKVKRIGIVPGSGASMIRTAQKEGCQVLITSDVKYHETREAIDGGLALIDPGHDGLELAVVDLLVSYLEELGRKKGWGIPIHGFKGNGGKPVWRNI